MREAAWRRLSQGLLVRWHASHEVRLLDGVSGGDLDELVLDVAKMASSEKAVAVMQSLELLGERAARMLAKEHLMEHILPRRPRAREAYVQVEATMAELNRCSQRPLRAEEEQRDRRALQEGLRRAFETLRDGLYGQLLPAGATVQPSEEVLECLRAVRALAREVEWD